MNSNRYRFQDIKVAAFILLLALAVAAAIPCYGQDATSRGVTTVKFTTTDRMVTTGLYYGIPIVPVWVNGHPAQFMLDTGAPLGAITEEFARKIGVLAQARKQTQQEDPGQTNPPLIDNLQTQIGGIEVDGGLFVVKGDQLFYFGKTEVDGIIGRNTLMNVAILLSFPQDTVTIFSPGNISNHDLENFGFGGLTPIPLKANKGRLIADAILNHDKTQIFESLVIDSGADVTVVSEDDYQKLKGKSVASLSNTTMTKGTFFQELFPIDQIGLGAIVVSNPTISYFKNNTTFPSVLGRDILSQYHTLIDVPALKMYLVPSNVPLPHLKEGLVPITP